MIELKFTRAILLNHAVAPLVGIAEEVTINYTPEELSIVASDPIGYVKAALRIKSSAFETFICDENSSARINLLALHRKLRLASEEDSITITGGDGETQIGIMFHNARADEAWFSNLAYTWVYNENTDINEFQNEYEACIGILSEDFNRIILHMCNFGSRVIGTLTDAEVTFDVEGEEDFISIEYDTCIIGGVGEDDAVDFMFTLYEMESLWRASLLSSSMWIFQSDISNCLLNFPIPEVGNLMYYHL